MTLDQVNTFCRKLPVTAHGVQWGGADVWKVGPWEGGKVFVIARADAISFKVSDIGWEVLREAKGCRPAPYLASRGMQWIQADLTGGLKAAELRSYLETSHALVAAGLSQKKCKELGLT
jgi:predicted DNA-binding protein (MmcQ/YjbR family)